MKLLLYAFGWQYGAAAFTAYALKKTPLISQLEQEGNFITFSGLNKSRIKSLIKKISIEKPTHIIGLGNYRKDSKIIRIEQEFMNKCGRNIIEKNGPEKVYSNWSIEPNELSKLTNYAGNGPCNMSAYLILRELEKSGMTNTKFAFLHIPAKFEVEKSREFIVSFVAVSNELI